MTGNAIITVGMPVYNGGRWLRQAVTAILAQTIRDLVLVISDNASTDDTPVICRSLATGDSRIRYIRNEANIGVYRNYDQVFRDCHTPYFKWAAANDLCAPTFLERCIRALEANPRAVLAAPRTVVFTDDPTGGDAYPWDLGFGELSPVSRFRRVLSEMRLNNIFNGVIRAEVLRTTGLNAVHWGSDILLMAELALRGELLLVDEHLFFRRVTPDSTNARRTQEKISEFFSSEQRNILVRPKWDFFRHCLAAIWRAPIGMDERLQCAAYVARLAWWARAEIWQEIRRQAPHSVSG